MCERVYFKVQGTVIIAKVGIHKISRIGVAIRNQRVKQKFHLVAKFDTLARPGTKFVANECGDLVCHDFLYFCLLF